MNPTTRPPRLVIPAVFSLVIASACGPTTPTGDAQTASDSQADSAQMACTDPNALPVGTDFGCWTCPDVPSMPSAFVGQPTGFRCSVCQPDPRITTPPRGDCYRCVPPEGGTSMGYC
ncbi:MAG: hypothetical protein Q8Q09_25435 [Deltaproteobacteria bacterium]|nr:hypothetical protein [Deltaproteobacteria bacterium]